MKSVKRICALFLMLLMLVTAVPFSALKAEAVTGAGAPTDLNYYACGVDISFWQAGDSTGKNVDFVKLKNSGCKFVILRIGYGQSVDSAFISFYKKARAAGMPLGLYMYGLKTTYSGAASDANWVISVIEQNNMYFEYPIYYDLEESSQNNLSSTKKNELCSGWCDTLANAGYFPGIYAGGSQICDHLTSSFKAKYDLWIPHVLSGAGSEWSSQFTYTSKNYNAKGYGMWQYSWSNIYGGKYIYDGVYKSGTTKVEALDLDVAYKDYPTIMKTYGYNNCGSDEKMLLKEAMDKAMTLKYNSFSASGVTALRNAYADAESVYNNASSSSDAYKNARTALETAMKVGAGTVISQGKSYTSTNCLYTAGDDIEYDDIWMDDGKKLTDGKKGEPDGGTEGFFGAKNTEIVVDLGSVQASNTYKIYMTAGDYGITVPVGNQLDLDVKVSNDKSTWTYLGSAADSVRTGIKAQNWETLTLTYNHPEVVNARYVKFTVTSYAANNFVWLDEVEVINGEPVLSGNIYVNGMNQRVTSGACVVFTPSFGTISVDTANHAWTANVVAKWVDGNRYEVVSKSFGEGENTPSITLKSGEIFIACHNWETGVNDGSAVPGSAANANIVNGLVAGDIILLEGIDGYNGKLGVVPYISIEAKEVVEPENPGEPDTSEPDTSEPDTSEPDTSEPENHVHTPGPVSCVADQICFTCGEVLAPAAGHDEGVWVEVEEGLFELRCTKCEEMLDSKIEGSEKPSEPINPDKDGPDDIGDNNNGNPEPEYVGLRGDVDMDDAIGMTDYILLKRYYFNTYKLNDDQLLRGDLDENGSVGMTDYILLKRVYFNTYELKNPYVYK